MKSYVLMMAVNELGTNNLPVACDTHSGLERTGVVMFLWRQDPGERRTCNCLHESLNEMSGGQTRCSSLGEEEGTRMGMTLPGNA